MFCKDFFNLCTLIFLLTYTENKKSIRTAVDDIAEDVLTLDINDSTSVQNSHNPTVQNVPMEGN